MQNYTTIIGVLEMRENNFSYRDCRARYDIGQGTVKLIIDRFQQLGEYSRAVKPPIRQAGNRLSGLTETTYASLLA